MNVIKCTALAALLGCLTPSWAPAVTLSLQPDNQSVTGGASFSVDLLVSGLGDTEAPALGDFEVDIVLDPSALSFSGYALGAMLGEVSLLESLDVSFGEVAPGRINLAQVSLLPIAELEALQTASFVLATLTFSASGLLPGESTAIDIASVLALGDAAGNPLAVDSLGGATVSAVPLPAAIWLLGAGLLSLALGRQRSISQVAPCATRLTSARARRAVTRRHCEQSGRSTNRRPVTTGLVRISG